jgi:hypothetical protein
MLASASNHHPGTAIAQVSGYRSADARAASTD